MLVLVIILDFQHCENRQITNDKEEKDFAEYRQACYFKMAE